MENDATCTALDLNQILEDSFKNTDGVSIDDEDISFSGKKTVGVVSKLKGKPLIDLNKLPEEAIVMDIGELEECGNDAFAIVKDSLEKDAHFDTNDEEASFVGKEEFTGIMVEQATDPPPHTPSFDAIKLMIDLNKYPEERPDF